MHLKLQAADPLLHLYDRTLYLQKGFVNRVFAVQVLVLCQITDGGALAEGHNAFVSSQLTNHDF